MLLEYNHIRRQAAIMIGAFASRKRQDKIKKPARTDLPEQAFKNSSQFGSALFRAQLRHHTVLAAIEK
jgi:hypothetical protein